MKPQSWPHSFTTYLLVSKLVAAKIWRWRHPLRQLDRMIEAWVLRRVHCVDGPVIVHRKRTYILPTSQGVVAGAMLLALLLVALNYNNSMVFALTFIFAALTFNSMLFVHRNLVGLEVTGDPAVDVFCGNTLQYRLQLHNRRSSARIAVHVERADYRSSALMLPAGSSVPVALPVLSQRRGRQHAPRFLVSTAYPFGMFRAWSWVYLRIEGIVYPKPADEDMPLPLALELGDGGVSRQGDDELSGLRPYRPGDTPRRIAWKSVARGQGMATKDFTSTGRKQVLLDWSRTPEVDPERRLSRLCRWVLQSEASGIPYGLRMPGVELPAAQGAEHRRNCLRSLAQFDRY